MCCAMVWEVLRQVGNKVCVCVQKGVLGVETTGRVDSTWAMQADPWNVLKQ